jgi:hypothetical protein
MLHERGSNGARAKEITLCFPATESSSILTNMRRKGLIAKAGPEQTAAWVLTAAGFSLLRSLGDYTPQTYWETVWGIGKYNTFKHLHFTGLNENHQPWSQPAYFEQYQRRSC